MDLKNGTGNAYTLQTAVSDTEKVMSKRDFCCTQLTGVIFFAAGILVGILIGIYAYHGGPDAEVTCKNLPDSMKATTATPDMTNPRSTMAPRPTQDPTPSPTQDQTPSPTHGPSPGMEETCIRREARVAWDGKDPQLFAPLEPAEYREIYTFLITENLIYKREPGQEVSLQTNYAPYMSLFPPNKQEVLSYKAGSGPFPGRFARVSVVRGDRAVPDYMEYKVGPLGINATLTATQLYADGELSFNSRPYDYVETAVYDKLLIPDFRILEPLTKESFDGAVYPRENNDFSFWYFNGPPGAKGGERETRIIAYLNPLAPNGYDFLELDFLPLSATIHCPGNDFNSWYIYDYYYLNQGPFENAQSLMDAFNSGNLRKFILPNGYRNTILDRHLPDRDTAKPLRPLANMPPPRTYEPEGPRYFIKGHNVDYMGWNFDVTSGQMRGPGLYAITYKGQSIAYELSLNEIGVVYGSGGSAQTNVIYTDSSYGIGEYYGIVQTVDCPKHATMLETTHWDVYLSEPVQHKSICVYEADGENALWRHKGLEFEGGLRNNFLVVKLSATIDNYDYIVEWHFYLDGKVYTIVSASGYIQGSFWDHENPFMGSDKSRDAFGYRVEEHTHGQIHDHMFGFKVDLDVLGTDNTMEVIKWKAADIVTALKSQGVNVDEKPPYFKQNITRYIDYEYVEREKAFRLNLDEPEFWVVVNQEEKNKWGAKRGYEIKPLMTSSQTLTDAHHSMPALSFTKHHCTVTMRKEEEQYLSSTSDVNRLDTPIGHLERYLNDEFINQTDIVNWVTVGFLHLPTSEDVPMTNRVESGFMLKPFNFFDKTEVFDMPGYLNTMGNWRTEREPQFKPCKENAWTDE